MKRKLNQPVSVLLQYTPTAQYVNRVDVPYCSKNPFEIVLSRIPAGGGEFVLVGRDSAKILGGFRHVSRTTSRKRHS
jgi:hypothetical protein